MQSALKDIVRAINKSDLKTFEHVFKEYYAMLCNFAYSYLKDEVQAEEIVQEVFYKIWEKRRTLRIKSSLKSYLMQAVKNTALKQIRHEQISNKYKDYAIHVDNKATIDPAEELNAKELAGIIRKTINDLPERCREIFTMSRYEGLKYSEIAKKLSISVKTVEANMGKALKIFREKLGEYREAV